MNAFRHKYIGKSCVLLLLDTHMARSMMISCKAAARSRARENEGPAVRLSLGWEPQHLPGISPPSRSSLYSLSVSLSLCVITHIDSLS